MDQLTSLQLQQIYTVIGYLVSTLFCVVLPICIAEHQVRKEREIKVTDYCDFTQGRFDPSVFDA